LHRGGRGLEAPVGVLRGACRGAAGTSRPSMEYRGVRSRKFARDQPLLKSLPLFFAPVAKNDAAGPHVAQAVARCRARLRAGNGRAHTRAGCPAARQLGQGTRAAQRAPLRGQDTWASGVHVTLRHADGTRLSCAITCKHAVPSAAAARTMHACLHHDRGLYRVTCEGRRGAVHSTTSGTEDPQTGPRTPRPATVGLGRGLATRRETHVASICLL
jgi:hypothetical protein